MRGISFGKHYGKSAELVVLKEPDYVDWMLGLDGATGRLPETRREVRGLVNEFDRKPILWPCQAPGCGNRATRCSLYQGGLQPRWWCEHCDPYQLGASPGKLAIVKTYLNVVTYVSHYCRGRRVDLKVLIRVLAQAKGLPARVGEPEARNFFSESPSTDTPCGEQD
jgi:hypothetical protein